MPTSKSRRTASKHSTKAAGRAISNGARSPCSPARGESIVAGLAGETYSGRLFTRYLWGCGVRIGRKLMADGEMRAVERGCHSAWVDTFSFQAPGFYPRLGYAMFGELDYSPDQALLPAEAADGRSQRTK